MTQNFLEDALTKIKRNRFGISQFRLATFQGLNSHLWLLATTAAIKHKARFKLITEQHDTLVNLHP
jgi:hypothetical protein